jgi:Arc/MetJ-type ribon-helix-helix transcriptional regulator
MKVSISLPDDDVAFLDEYATSRGLDSRSAALQKAVRLLRSAELSQAYAAAWEAWPNDADARPWESTVGDGIEPT